MNRQRSAHVTSLVGITLVLLPAAGCLAPSHKTAKMEAQTRWNNVRADIKRALSERKLKGGLFEEAIDSATEAVGLNPSDPRAYVVLARAHLELGEPASSQRTLRSAEQAHLDSSELAYMRGVLTEQRGDIRQAMSLYAHSLDLKPSYVDAVVAYTECLAELGRPKEALAVIDKHVNQVDARGVLSGLAVHLAVLTGDPDEALKRFRDAIATSADVSLSSPNVAALLMRAHRYAEAVSVLAPVVAESDQPDSMSEARLMLATSYLEADQPALAVDVLQVYARANPRDTSAQLLLAEAAILVGKYVTAQDAVNRVQDDQPNLAEIYFLHAVILWQRGDSSAARASLDKLFTLKPDDVDGHCLMGELLADQGHQILARQHFERALALEPGCAWAQRALEKKS